MVDIYDSSTDEWTSAPPLQGGARYHLAAATVGNIAIFAGGYNGQTTLDTVDVFNASVPEMWSLGPPLQGGARQFLAAASIGTKVIFAGGLGDTYSASVDIYDASTNEWELGPELQGGARYYLAAATTDTAVIFAGGLLNDSMFASTVDIYDSLSDSWSLGPPLPCGPRSEIGTASIANKGVFVGGVGGSNEIFECVDVYDGLTSTWISYNPLPIGSSSLSSGVIGDLAFFAGGWTMNSAESPNVFVLNITSTEWISAPALQIGREYVFMASNDSALMIVGGREDEVASGATDIYYLTWSDPPPNTPNPTTAILVPTTMISNLSSISDYVFHIKPTLISDEHLIDDFFQQYHF